MAETGNPVARAHHYVPQLYLAGFTDSGTRDGRLYAHDYKQLKTWPSSPRGVGFEKDYYRLDLPSQSPDGLEKVLGLIEGPASAILRDILERRALPTGDEFAQFMQFVALLTVRVPSVRAAAAKGQTDLMKLVLSMHAHLPDGQLAAKFERMRREDPSMPETSIDEFREYAKKVANGEIALEMTQAGHMRGFVEGHLSNLDTITRLLMARQWTLIAAEDGAGEFVCSDHPVDLEWTVDVPPFYRDSPGFALENTVVYLPLSRKLLLRGTFGGRLGGMTLPVGRDMVATVNSLALRKVTRFLFTPKPDFSWVKADGSVGGVADLFAAIAEHRKLQADTREAPS